jgi:peptidoglycan/LPS O-acetylase OafA/YrhL
MDITEHAEPDQLVDDNSPDDNSPDEVSPPSGWRYVPGLDGIRALAVLSVLAYHGGISAVNGGLLGVDIFFVLSGFLITSLLVSEFRKSGAIGFGAFYARRARRLLPALGITLLGVALYAAFVADPGTLATIRGDALSTMAYVANWRFIVTDQSYFVHFGAPSPLLHTWSLAVEEQFYLVWPALSLFVLRRRGADGLFVVALLLVVGSFVDGVILLHTGASSSRLYYGTDLRVQEVMAGAALAAFWGGTQGTHATSRHRTTAPSEHPTWRRVLAGGGTLGLVVLLYAIHAVDGQGSFLYEGGFVMVAVATVLVIATVVKLPDGLLAAGFSLRPLRYVGRISYGLYLYHWPIFQTLNEPRTDMSGLALFALRVGVTFGVSVVSFHLIESPIRRHSFSLRSLVIGLPAIALLLVAALVLSTQSGALGNQNALPPSKPGSPLALPPVSARPRGTPVSALLLGDSMGATLGEGLVEHSTAWGVDLTNKAVPGCDLLGGQVRFANGPPAPAPTYCLGWQQTWASEVASYKPEVVMIQMGRWEILDREIDGTWYSIADAALQRMVEDALNQAVEIVSADGAKVALGTLPYVKGTVFNLDGSPLDLNQPWRSDIYNAIVRRVAAEHPGTVQVVDVNRMLDPGGSYTDFIDGIRVRYTDEEHPTPAAGELLRSEVLPVLYRLGRAARSSATTTTRG